MRILNQDIDKSLKKILIILTPSEAAELRDDLEELLQENKKNQHIHINDMEYTQEISIAIYRNGESLNQFDERTQNLITMDE